MHQLLGEYLGTALLILLGNGVVANVNLKHTYAHGGGWIVITFGWAMAVFVGVFVASKASGGHLNPAFTIALAAIGKFSWQLVPGYIAAQILGAMTGSLLVWLTFYKHYALPNDAGTIKATFCTEPAIRKYGWNLITEIIGAFVLVFSVFKMSAPAQSLGTLDALPVAFIVLAIGLSLGGVTGYAINPARDLGPRIMHALLPIPGKGTTDWQYSWVPIVGPIIGALLAAFVFELIT
ncbi:MAG: MIP family channel protein [Hydrotalea flava]|uniref:MIP/aquaporin family protein n=1 Tax=Hydrotalea flava TaxID=714549 RepID=UPI000832EF31|nr:MIP/aquaporin family protein [Hydrotalea flava]RTL48533.1 MAG: MIP family channel protein [Sphingobacteriales bacterium]NIM35835.1 MIP family channel protein [Hydrotalea flava]NIM38687.1 MIP family channel protein [Hydrotalea flava]NIN03875.1 MIP family channel protein [Hydrotalea flava]NIN15596.1 MIP family channel protein [Hydrotalea flava]